MESVDISEEFAHEKLSPVLAMYKAKTFDEAIAKAQEGGADVSAADFEFANWNPLEDYTTESYNNR